MSSHAITARELLSLWCAKSAAEWDAACDAIKAARGGVYPPDWWEVVHLCGLAHAVQQSGPTTDPRP